MRFLCALLVALALSACDRDGPPTAETSTSSTAVVAGNRFEVTGTLTELGATAAVTDPLPTPFTIQVRDRGVGGAEISGATANGKAVQINWNAGQPLPVTGANGGLSLNAAAVHVLPDKISWSLDGAARDFLPGNYRLGSSVAIGEKGLARPVDSATFTATDGTSLSTRGDASITIGAREIRFEGSEGSLAMAGTLTLHSEAGDREVERLLLGPGTYTVTLTPVDGGYAVVANLEGRVVT